jgi:hypothetical protein
LKYDSEFNGYALQIHILLNQKRLKLYIFRQKLQGKARGSHSLFKQYTWSAPVPQLRGLPFSSTNGPNNPSVRIIKKTGLAGFCLQDGSQVAGATIKRRYADCCLSTTNPV